MSYRLLYTYNICNYTKRLSCKQMLVSTGEAASRGSIERFMPLVHLTEEEECPLFCVVEIQTWAQE